MEKVIEAVREVSHNNVGEGDEFLPGGRMLKAAKEFSSASIDSFSGDLLNKAMKLVIALADFAHELNGKGGA